LRSVYFIKIQAIFKTVLVQEVWEPVHLVTLGELERARTGRNT